MSSLPIFFVYLLNKDELSSLATDIRLTCILGKLLVALLKVTHESSLCIWLKDPPNPSAISSPLSFPKVQICPLQFAAGVIAPNRLSRCTSSTLLDQNIVLALQCSSKISVLADNEGACDNIES